MHKLVSYLILFVFLLNSLHSQTQINRPDLGIKKATDAIKLDGYLEEKSWEAADKSSPFFNKFPSDSGYAEVQTEVKLCYDDQNLYIGVICWDTDEYVVQTLKRDNEFFDSDGIAVVLDPINRRTNGFFFGVNPYGTQTEGLITNNFDDPLALDWDNRWFVEVQNMPDHWSVEIQIPFKTLRYEGANLTWGLNFIRNNIKHNVFSTWSRVPINFLGTDLGYTGRLNWDQPPPIARGNVSLIPYTIGGLSRDFEEGEPLKPTGNLGMDAKVALGPSMNLDLTVNPDFSQVEVDQQQTNLDRFSLFFPEKRNFFLENSDLFSTFGIPPVRPFFSRQIGLQTTGTSQPIPIPIYLGARLSGNLTNRLRVGLMSMQTGPKEDILGQNISVGVFQQQVLKRSSVTGILINRQAFSEGGAVSDDFGRNAGMEFNYLSQDGSWSAWAQLHGSFDPERYDDNLYYCVGFMRAGRNFNWVTSYSNTQQNFLTDVGFNPRLYNYDAETDSVIRLGYQILFQNISLSFFPEDIEAIAMHSLSAEIVPIFNPDNSLNSMNNALVYQIMFNNQSSCSLSYKMNDVRLPFDTYVVGEKPFVKGKYTWQTVAASYSSDPRKSLFFTAGGEIGGFYDGDIRSYRLELNYRKQPWGNFALSFEQNQIQSPTLDQDLNLLLIGPRIEINFSRNIFWTTFIQYNTQWDNFNINSRFQWRFQPMSDLFIVYTDNYAVEQFGVKNRALVLKLNYWWTL